MRLAIHQPEYWPIPRLLAKWASVDLLILLDIADFDRASLQHRCRLAPRGLAEDRWLTIPFQHTGQSQPLRMVEPADATWPHRHITQIREWYRGVNGVRLQTVGDWYRAHAPASMDATQSVALYAAATMTSLVEWCQMAMPPVIFASALRPPDGGWGRKGDLVLNLCRAVRAETYLAGVRGAQYLDWASFERAGISIEVQAFATPADLPGRSQAELSALHAYLTDGPEAVRVATMAKAEARR